MDYSRRKEIAKIESEKQKLRNEKFAFSVENIKRSGATSDISDRSITGSIIREFIDFIIT